MYKLAKEILFKIDAEKVHENMLSLGEFFGEIPIATSALSGLYSFEDEMLTQTVSGIKFNNPVGLAAGFDYDAKLTQVLPSIGFGFETIGTVTNMPYEGNPYPRLGRLPKSKSLLVNKGFKSKGASKISGKLSKRKFKIPIGISIGRTNSSLLQTQEQSVADIIQAFTIFEKSNLNISYYELNVSCPNLIHGNTKITFYSKENLEQLLQEVDKLKISKPIFVKMPIILSNDLVLEMLQVISDHKLTGIVFGNLETNKNNPEIIPAEANVFSMGNFSGKPTFIRSNELIELAYRNFGKTLKVVGCGGIFSAEDAFEKISRGATLLELITGMIFEGPALIKNINKGLVKELKKRGFDNISQAVGCNVK